MENAVKKNLTACRPKKVLCNSLDVVTPFTQFEYGIGIIALYHVQQIQK